MRVILESTTKIVELVRDARTADGSKRQHEMSTRLWQGKTCDLNLTELALQLRERADAIDAMYAARQTSHTPAGIAAWMRDVATLAAGVGEIDVHAFIARIAHPIDAPPGTVDAFRLDLKAHAAPRAEYDRAYSLRMFI